MMIGDAAMTLRCRVVWPRIVNDDAGMTLHGHGGSGVSVIAQVALVVAVACGAAMWR